MPQKKITKEELLSREIKILLARDRFYLKTDIIPVSLLAKLLWKIFPKVITYRYETYLSKTR